MRVQVVMGEAIIFRGAEIEGDWIHLSRIETLTPGKPFVRFGSPEDPFPNGMDVSLESIDWIAIEPFGPQASA